MSRSSRHYHDRSRSRSRDHSRWRSSRDRSNRGSHYQSHSRSRSRRHRRDYRRRSPSSDYSSDSSRSQPRSRSLSRRRSHRSSRDRSRSQSQTRSHRRHSDRHTCHHGSRHQPPQPPVPAAPPLSSPPAATMSSGDRLLRLLSRIVAVPQPATVYPPASHASQPSPYQAPGFYTPGGVFSNPPRWSQPGQVDHYQSSAGTLDASGSHERSHRPRTTRSRSHRSNIARSRRHHYDRYSTESESEEEVPRRSRTATSRRRLSPSPPRYRDLSPSPCRRSPVCSPEQPAFSSRDHSPESPLSASHTRALSPHPLSATPSAFGYESQAENYDRDDYYNDYDDYDFACRRPRGPMVPISIGISGSLSAKQSPDQSVDRTGVPTSSVYCEDRPDDDFANSTWESPANVLVVHEGVAIVQDTEVGADTEEDAFSEWLQSYPESDPAEAAVDSVSFFGSDSAPSSPGCSDCNGIPQQPRRLMSPNGVSVSTNPCQLFPPLPLVSLNISTHEITSSISYSRSPPSAASIFSQSADTLRSPTIQPAREANEVIDVASSTKVSADNVGEHALSAWPSSYFKFYAEEYSKESYSAVQSDPVYAESDSNDEYEVLAAPAESSRVHMAADPMREEFNRNPNPSLLTAGPLEPHVLTPLSRDPQPSLLLESPSSSFVSVTSLSILPSALSVSSSSMSVPSSSLSAFHSSSCLSPASSALFHDQVPLSRSISVLSPFTNVSDDSFRPSSPAAVSHEAEVTCACHLAVTESPPILRPPEDPPPDVADELKDWFRAYISLGIAEPALPSASFPSPTSSDSGDFSGFLAPTDEFEMDPLPFADVAEDSPPGSQDSYNTFSASRSVWSHPRPHARSVYDEVGNDDERDFRSYDSLSSASPSSTSFDDLRPTLGYGENLLSPTTGLEIDISSLCFQELRNVAHGCRSDSVLPARVDTLDSDLKPEFAQPLFCAPTLDGKPCYAKRTPASVVWLADLSPTDEYSPQSEPEPPDPSCASH